MSVIENNFGSFESSRESPVANAWSQQAFSEILSDRMYSTSSRKVEDPNWLSNLVWRTALLPTELLKQRLFQVKLQVKSQMMFQVKSRGQFRLQTSQAVRNQMMDRKSPMPYDLPMANRES